MHPVGKGATLEHIAREFPDIPVPPFVCIPPEVTWHPWFLFGKDVIDKFGFAVQKLARDVGYPLLVRSDARYEDGLGKSFAGLFDSQLVRGSWELEDVLRRVREVGGTPDFAHDRRWAAIEAYAQDRGVAIEKGPIDVLFHKFVPSHYRVLITEHPNLQDAYFIDIETLFKDGGRNRKEGYLFKGEKEVRDAFGNSELGDALVRAVNDYGRVREIFPDDVSFQAEMTLFDYALVQWRPFRKKEYADFAINDVAPSRKREDVHHFPMVLGITPPEGVLCAASEWRAETRISESPSTNATGWIPKVAFFFRENLFGIDEDKKRYACAPLQSHDLFRFLERDVRIGFGKMVPDEYGVPMRYWSDGREGRAQLLDP